MPLQTGSRIGPYEVLGAIGAGGMGEVYRARDTSLGREVAIKVLPDQFGDDVDRLARFEREARTLASLNHPNIAAIYGIETSGATRAIVMELVEGDDLSALIGAAKATPYVPLSITDALAIARQIAAALEAAHGQGVIHRDLKPANIKVRSDGTVKVLDFGLAKAIDPSVSGAAKATPYAQSESPPTMTSPAMTAIGMILGTAAYMAPEQAKGRTLDKRADVWALGAVLYEMLTGARAFPGDDMTETIAAVVRGEPDWSALPRDLPPTLTAFLKRCLAKLPADRVQDIGDMRLALEGAFDGPASSQSGPPADPTGSRRSSAPLMALAALALIAVSGAAAWSLKSAPAEPAKAMRQFVVEPGPGPFILANTNRDIQITPDGSRLIYLAGQGGERTLYARPLDALQPIPLRKGDRFFDPFVSPDSKWVAFNDEGDFVMKKVPITGGPAVTIARTGREIAGATWGVDGTIIFGYSGFESGLWRISDGARTPEALTTPDKTRGEAGHYWPEFLPGGQAIVYTVRVGPGGSRSEIWAMDLKARAPKRLVETGTGARYSEAGFLLYGADNALWAVRFDAATLETSGDAVQINDSVPAKASGALNVSVSSDGSLAYLSAATATVRRRLVWIDRGTGARQPVDMPQRGYTTARVSPDGTRVALDIRDEGGDIWIWDLARNVSTKITDDPSSDANPNWTPEGGRIVFQSGRNGIPNLYVQAADGTGVAERLTDSPNTQYPSGVARDGSVLSWELGVTAPLDVFMVPLSGPTRVQVPLLHTAAAERNPEPSPDGQWLAYASNEGQATQQEIYVRPFPNVSGGRVQVSSGGGLYPMWLPRTGSELFYVRPDGRLVSVPMRDGAPSGSARVVVDGGFFMAPNPRTFDISPDGKRFLVIEDIGDQGSSSAGIVVVLNWADDLKRRMAAGG
jgi:serine/threonine protein kinase/Tol biopolymer transport system component